MDVSVGVSDVTAKPSAPLVIVLELRSESSVTELRLRNRLEGSSPMCSNRKKRNVANFKGRFENKLDVVEEKDVVELSRLGGCGGHGGGWWFQSGPNGPSALVKACI